MPFMYLICLLFCFKTYALTTGQMAPDFSAMGVSQEQDKMEIKLSSFKGKIVVLEWLNHGCPFIKKHYGPGQMQKLQKQLKAQGVVWLSVISSAPGKQGHVTPAEAKKDLMTHGSAAHGVILDPEGKIGKTYEAKTTPHMFVVDREGKIAYQGAIDDKPDTDPASISGAKNYVEAAIKELMENKKVSQNTTKAYGCGVKY